MGLISFLGVVAKLFFGSEDKPQQLPPQERPPQRPHRPYRPQEGRPPQPHAPSTSPPKQHQQQHKPHSPRPTKQQHHDSNQVNQDDPHYVSLRARANDEGDKMAQCFKKSKRAYATRDRARAKELSNEAKEHKAKMERLNKEASAWVYAKNNEDSSPGEIDLHGLYVKEAINYTDRAIEAAKRRGDTTINIIVGKGLHSNGGVARLKPAIEALMRKHNLVAELDPNNAGVLIVQLGGRKSGRRAIGVDEVTRRLEKSEGCVIM
ncbi:Smr-domain-containing protein [Thelephora ganbajun]|uniref:Smr-domain-containing protein n=1 Tax=Thelephora ganbajun TaxID=370292 RepID=A0ACB6ZLZ3_THEGA|nr:Smr-domain-containing protein [Thelephora ganbajun]